MTPALRHALVALAEGAFTGRCVVVAGIDTTDVPTVVLFAHCVRLHFAGVRTLH